MAEVLLGWTCVMLVALSEWLTIYPPTGDPLCGVQLIETPNIDGRDIECLAVGKVASQERLLALRC